MKKNRRFWRAASSAAAARLNSSSSRSSSSNDNTNINNNNSVSSSTTTMQRLQLGECVPYQAPFTPEQVQLKRVVVVTIATSTRKCNNNASETIGASTASGETKESTAKTTATITSSTDADQLQEPTENINNISKHHDFDDDEDDGGDDKEEDCPICLELLDRSSYYHHSHHHHHHYTSPKVVVKLKTCQHTFHQACLQDSWKHQNTVQCPVCRIPAVEQTFGKSPSGTMMVSILLPRTTCPGFSSSTTTQTLQLQYTIPSGVQQSYHEHPGQAYHGTTRIAYLPYNKEGLQLLQRLVYAFEHGYTFQVGTSLTTGRPNSVIWSSIHHKTSLHGGVHGFPDASYLENCHGSLDALHIPPVTATTTATGTAAATMTATAAQNERTWNSWTNPSSFPFQVHYHAPTFILPSMEDAMILLSPRGAAPHKKRPKHFQNGVVSSSSHSDNLAMMPDGKHQVSHNSSSCDYDTYCSKCHNAITDDTTTTTALCISTCQHIFHESCWMPPTWNCPICHALVVAPNQTSPSGILRLRILSNQTCPGFDSNNNNNNNTKVMECRYEIPPNQIQQPYHPNPGLSIPSTTRITYLPFNEQGCDLYIRLRYAWKNGYIFKIGTSLTTGKSNVVVWNAAIPHKTSLHGGLFGFPDASYLMACHAALDALEIPDSTACWEKWEQERVGNTNR